MPRSATPVDFAYSVHSDIGHKCVGAKVNGRMVPLRTSLQNGDQVEIITAKNQTPSPSWEKFVITGKARSEVRKFIRSQQRQEYISLGKAILDKEIKSAALEVKNSHLKKVAAQLKKASIADLYYSIGDGTLAREDVIDALSPENTNTSPLSFLSLKSSRKKIENTRSNSVPIKGLIPGMALHYAGCCHPLPGDKIIGVIHTGKGVTIHTSDCDMLANFASTPERMIDLTWDADGSKIPFIGRLKVTIINDTGSLAILSSSIAKEDSNISKFIITNRNADVFEIIVDIEVRGIDHLNSIITSLRSCDAMNSVERFKL